MEGLVDDILRDVLTHVAQDVVDQAFHGRQSNLHGSHSKKSPAVYAEAGGLDTD